MSIYRWGFRSTLLIIALLLVSFSALTATAEDPQTITFDLLPLVVYHDSQVDCQNDHSPARLRLTLTIVGANRVSARLDEIVGGASQANRELSLAEMKSIRFTPDTPAHLRQITLGERTLAWIFANNGARDCRPSTPLASLAPAPFTFILKQKPMEGAVPAPESPVTGFSGKTTGGLPFTAYLRISEWPR